MKVFLSYLQLSLTSFKMILKLMHSRYSIAEVLAFKTIYSGPLESFPNTCTDLSSRAKTSLRSYRLDEYLEVRCDVSSMVS